MLFYTTTMNNTECTKCPVANGTHKPAEALHQQIDEPALQALRERMQFTHARLGHAERFVEAPAAVVAEVIKLADRQRARVAELESQLEAIGAGGVEPLRKPASQQAVQAAVPEGWKLVPIKVPDSAFAWVSGGYPAGYKAWDERDTAVVHERAQRAWEAILNGITAPAQPAEGVPAQDWQDAVAEAAQARAAGYEGDDRKDIKTDVFNAFAKGADWERRRAAFAATQPAPAIFGDEDHVLVPRGLIGAACYAIDKKRDGTKTLAELRRYTTGDLSAAPQPAAQGMDAPESEYQRGYRHGYNRRDAEVQGALL